VQNSCQLTTKWVPGWRPFHNNLLFCLQADFRLIAVNLTLSHQPATSRHFTQLNCWQLNAARRVSSICNLVVDPTESTASSNPSIVAVGGCLTIGWTSFPRERVYRTFAQKRVFVYPTVAVIVIHIEVCPYATIWWRRSQEEFGTVHHTRLFSLNFVQCSLWINRQMTYNYERKRNWRSWEEENILVDAAIHAGQVV
jgi:hypothetical protein